jgi:methionyl-tRNA formyltransferase
VAPRLTKADGVIDWTRPARSVHNLVRGLHPWPHAFTFHGSDRFILIRTTVDPTTAAAAPPGTVVEARGDRLVIATGDGAIQVVEIQPEGKRALRARDFLAGHRLAPGDRFAAAP